MSDDTPTQRFDHQGGDAPTERLSTPETGETGQLVQEERKNRRLFIILGIIGGALLLAIIILLVVLLTQNNAHSTGASTATPTPTASASATPTASSTPSVSPTPTPTPTPTTDPQPPQPQPPSNAVKIDKFSGTSTIRCNTQAPVQPDYTVFFEWRTTNAAQIFFGVATADASTGALFTNLPPNGNSQNDFEYQLEFPCPAASQNYTLTVVGNNGDKVSKNIVITNNGDKQ